MNRMFGTVVRGVRAPIFREGDDVVKGTVDTVLKALKENGVEPHDKDVVAITESVVARTQGNYATVEQIAADVRARTGGKTVGVTFPILSRNRFSVLLSGIAAGCEKSFSCSVIPPMRLAITLSVWTFWTKRGLTHGKMSFRWSVFEPNSGRWFTPSPAWTM